MTHCIPRAALAAALLAGTAGLAVAQEGQAQLRLKALAGTCANCHGTNGRAIEGSAVPGLAGMPAGYFVEQMKAFQSGARQATVMHQLAKGFSEAQVQQLAGYFSALPRGN